MKYILKEKIPFTDYEVGHVFETNFAGDIKYRAKDSENIMMPHEVLLMVKAGILEEYDDTFPKIGDTYYITTPWGVRSYAFYDDNTDKHNIKTNNCFRTEEEAKARLKEITGE